MMDAGFAIIVDLMGAGRALDRTLEQNDLAGQRVEIRKAKALISRALWTHFDRWVAEPLDGEPNPGVDATADTSDAMSGSGDKLSQGIPCSDLPPSDSSAAIPEAMVEHIARCGE